MSLSTYLPRDDDGAPLETLPHRVGGGWVMALAAGEALQVIGPFPPVTRIVTMQVVGTAIFWQTGVNNSITVAVPMGNVAGGGPHYLSAGSSVDIALQTPNPSMTLQTFIAVISATGTAGTVYVSERG